MHTRRNFRKASEQDLIEWLRTRRQPPSSHVKVGIGDDAAVVRPPADTDLCLSHDLLVEGVDFKKPWIHPALLGRKALRVNLSDLGAMGAKPLGALLGVTVPPEDAGDWFRSFAEGFLEESTRWSCPLIGGDLSAGEGIQIAVTVLGHCVGPPLLRSGARPGQRVYLSGRVGLSRMGLQILREEDSSLAGRLATEEALRDWAGSKFRFGCLTAHLLPEPQLDVGAWLSREGLAGAAIDISDGLAADLLRLAVRSGVAVELNAERLEELGAYEGEELPLDFLLNGGEDFALAFTVSPENIDRLHSTAPHDFPPLLEIGRVCRGRPSLFLAKGGQRTPYEPRGFDHFRR